MGVCVQVIDAGLDLHAAALPRSSLAWQAWATMSPLSVQNATWDDPVCVAGTFITRVLLQGLLQVLGEGGGVQGDGRADGGGLGADAARAAAAAQALLLRVVDVPRVERLLALLAEALAAAPRLSARGMLDDKTALQWQACAAVQQLLCALACFPHYRGAVRQWLQGRPAAAAAPASPADLRASSSSSSASGALPSAARSSERRPAPTAGAGASAAAAAGYDVGRLRLQRLLDLLPRHELPKGAADKAAVAVALRGLADSIAKPDVGPEDLARADKLRLHFARSGWTGGVGVVLPHVPGLPLQPQTAAAAGGVHPGSAAAAATAAASSSGGGPAAVAALVVRMCANRRCHNFSGASEAGLRLGRCAGCRVVRYCSPRCQAQHWAGGHKQECCSMAG